MVVVVVVVVCQQARADVLARRCHVRRTTPQVNGVPSCASSDLLNGNLRDKWGFNGYAPPRPRALAPSRAGDACIQTVGGQWPVSCVVHTATLLPCAHSHCIQCNTRISTGRPPATGMSPRIAARWATLPTGTPREPFNFTPMGSIRFRLAPRKYVWCLTA